MHAMDAWMDAWMDGFELTRIPFKNYIKDYNSPATEKTREHTFATLDISMDGRQAVKNNKKKWKLTMTAKEIIVTENIQMIATNDR